MSAHPTGERCGHVSSSPAELVEHALTAHEGEIRAAELAALRALQAEGHDGFMAAVALLRAGAFGIAAVFCGFGVERQAEIAIQVVARLLGARLVRVERERVGGGAT